ncbi:MAG: DNA recombination protein RmuC [Bdellovibrio sp.]|nr:MAG: DNA recombination protein RmuC [Bdellovibrio sp.]
MDPITITLSLCLAFLLALWLISLKKLKSLKESKIRLEAQNQALQQQLEDRERTQENILNLLELKFGDMAQKALEGSNQQFLNLAKAFLEKEQVQSQHLLDQKAQSISQLIEPLKEQLHQYHQYINLLEKERQKSYVTVENELKRVAELNAKLTEETAALKNALKKPHVRGRWGELQLKSCIEIAGMSEYADVTFQNTSEDGAFRPDMTVRMPGGRVVIVDAKTPLDAFMSALEAPNEELRKAEMARHGKHIKEHIRKLSSKDYAEQFKNSADFTVLFLPNESFLYAALEAEPDIIEYALERKILIASPPTLIGLLKVIRYGWNEERLAENAQKISEAGKELHKRVCDFMDAYLQVGKSLEKAKTEYDKGFSRLKSRVLVQAKKLENMGAKSKKDLPAEVYLDLPDEKSSTKNTN